MFRLALQQKATCAFDAGGFSLRWHLIQELKLASLVHGGGWQELESPSRLFSSQLFAIWRVVVQGV